MDDQDFPDSTAEPLKQLDVRGLKHFKTLLPLFHRLHEVGCARDKAGNRQLFFDGYCALVMLYLFNPLINSMRTLLQAVKLPKVSRAIGVKSFSLGSFSESPRVFEPEQLKGIIEELAGQVRLLAPDPRLKDLKGALTLVDGTVLSGLSRLASAACEQTRFNTSRAGRGMYGWRMHTQLDLSTFVPHRVDCTGARNAGESRENNVLRRTLEAGRCYVGDGGYADRTLMDDVVAAQSGYVIRIPENSALEVLEERELSREALEAGVVRDAMVRWGSHADGRETMNHTMRLVVVRVKPHPHRSRKGTFHSDQILIATSYVDLAAELVALIYRYRYSVELFFRFFKQLLGMRHLLSHREEGVQIQVYCAVIACLMISGLTGRKPDKRTVEMLGWFLMGLADEQDVLNHLNKPDNRGVKLRARAEELKKMGF